MIVKTKFVQILARNKRNLFILNYICSFYTNQNIIISVNAIQSGWYCNMAIINSNKKFLREFCRSVAHMQCPKEVK